jgi:hypothetical protein
MAGSIDEAAYKRKRDHIREQRDELERKLEQANERLDDAHGDRAIHFRTRETSQIAVG